MAMAVGSSREAKDVKVSWSPTTVARLGSRWERLTADVRGLEQKGMAGLLDSAVGAMVGFVLFAPFVVLGLLIFGSRDDATVTAVLAGALLLLLILVFLLAGLVFVLPFRRGAYLSTTGLLVRPRTFGQATTIPWSEVGSVRLHRATPAATVEQVSAVRTTGEAIDLPRIARSMPRQEEGADGRPRRRRFYVDRSLPDLVDALNALVPVATFAGQLRARLPDEAFIRAVPGYGSDPELLVVAGDVPPGATPDSVARYLESAGAQRRASSSDWASWSGVGPGGSFTVEVGALADLLDESPNRVRRTMKRPLRHHDVRRCVVVAFCSTVEPSTT